MEALLVSLIKLFVATDAVGTLPVYIGLTEGMSEEEKRRTVKLSVITSFLIVLGFSVVGSWLLRVLGVSVCDFEIAGGLLLLILSVDILMRNEQAKAEAASSERIGVVPLGTPLIAGPCVLTLVLLLADSVGVVCTLVAALVNVVLAGLIFANAGVVTRLIGSRASKAFAKVSSLLLAGLAVTLMRQGIIAAIEHAQKSAS